MESFLGPSKGDILNEQEHRVKKETQPQRKTPKGKGCGETKSSLQR